MRGISIFAKPSSFIRRRTLPYACLFRGSSMIRGEQVAAALGARLNPTEGYEDDLCIHVKPDNMDNVRDGDWVDIVDGDGLVNWIIQRPGVNAIAVSECTAKMYRSWMNNRLEVIEPHHCNFDREKRTRKEITTVGYIGGEIVFSYPFEEMRKLVEGVGLEFIWCCDYQTREEVVEFHKQIDIALIWSGRKFRQQSRGPTKFINAASFGIPVVGYPQVCCDEIEGKYVKAETLDELTCALEWLKDPGFYRLWANNTEWTEYYHISRVAERYKALDDSSILAANL